MNVLFCASEAAPFAASGGLGDVAGSLPRAIRNRKVACRVVMPLYGDMKQLYHKFYGSRRLAQPVLRLV